MDSNTTESLKNEFYKIIKLLQTNSYPSNKYLAELLILDLTRNEGNIISELQDVLRTIEELKGKIK